MQLRQVGDFKHEVYVENFQPNSITTLHSHMYTVLKIIDLRDRTKSKCIARFN